MAGCFYWVLIAAGLIFVMVTMIRWFEQTADAFDSRDWHKVTLLILMPFTVWLFPSRVVSGRPVAVPHHDPVMGMGAAPKAKPIDGPPPGTPKEFIGMPTIPPKKAKSSNSIDPDKIARLKQKMREQGMLNDDDDDDDEEER